MKHNNHLPTMWLLIITTALFTILTLVFKNTMYCSYHVNYMKEPALTALMQGAGDRKFPWDNTVLVSNTDTTPSTEESVIETLSETEEEEESLTDTNKIYTFENGSSSYFDDALFIGDSRTVGLHDYSNLSNATFYSKVSSTIFGIMDDPMITVSGNDISYNENTNISIRNALRLRQFGKIYIMVGINELGTGNADTFYDKYKSVVHDIQKLQPDALIFIQSIMHVTTQKSQQDEIYNNKNIDDRNDKIKELANNHNIFYLDLNKTLDDESKGLNSDYTFDSVHLKASKYSLWEDFLLKHCIDIKTKD